jgi:hypothetical protein
MSSKVQSDWVEMGLFLRFGMMVLDAAYIFDRRGVEPSDRDRWGRRADGVPCSA